MILRALAFLHDAVQAVRDHVQVIVNLGDAYPREDRGIAVTAWGVHVQADSDGLMVLRTGAVQSDDEDCDHSDGDPDLPHPCTAWVVMPDSVRSWLERVAEGETVDEVMTGIELAGLDEEVGA